MTQPPSAKPVKIGRGPSSLVAGATYPLRALWLFIRTPALRRYIILPIALNIVLGITIYAGLLIGGFRAIDAIIANLPLWSTSVASELHRDFSTVPTHLVAASQTLAQPVSHWSLPLPSWLALPDWHWSLTLPNWLALPDWRWNLPAGWHWPTWQTPDWWPDWQIQLPDWVGALPQWGLSLAIGLLRLVLVFVLLLGTGFIFLQFGVLLGAPWYGKLSEEIEKVQTGQVVLIEVNPLVDISRAILYELKKLVLTIAIGLPLLLLNVVPGFGTLAATIGGIALTSTIVCMDFFDATIERRRLRFRQKLANVFRAFPASASFGLICLGLVSIPLINLLAIPICVAAGTLFCCDRVLPELPQRPIP